MPANDGYEAPELTQLDTAAGPVGTAPLIASET